MGIQLYSEAVPTLWDSTIIGGQHFSTFIVRAEATNGYFWDSEPVSGWSVDNKAPPVPEDFALEVFDTYNVQLTWNTVLDQDLSHYSLYRSEESGFSPSDLEEPLVILSDTTYADMDLDVFEYYYLLHNRYCQLLSYHSDLKFETLQHLHADYKQN